MIEKPKVSICMITYGHEKYIREAIEGVLMQKTSFQIELVLANDCSTDKTDLIIQDILNNHPRSSTIEYINQSQNIGMMPNFIDALKNCKGEYIAFCEGDDYWTDPYKLQKQVEFMGANPEYTITTHNVYNMWEDENGTILKKYEWFGKLKQQTYSINDILRTGSKGATCSIVFKKNSIPNTDLYEEFHGGDLLTQIFATQQGKLYYFNEVMGVYRKNPESVSMSKSLSSILESHVVHTWIKFKKILPIEFKQDINFALYNSHIPELMKNLRKEKRYLKYITYKIKFRLKLI